MSLMTSSDMIRVHVHDDGDIELQKHTFSHGLTTLYPGDLFYDLQQVTDGRLDHELMDYGVDPEDAYKYIHEVITADYGTTIEVK